MKRKNKIFLIIIASVFGVIILLNLSVRVSPAFADFYRTRIYPAVSNCFSRICGLFGFSVGEIIIIVLSVFLVAAVLSLIILLIACKKKRRAIAVLYGKIIACLAAAVLLPMTTNCFMLYHASPLSVGERKAEFDSVFVGEVMNYLTEKINELEPQMKRDEANNLVLTDDLCETAKKAMLGISPQYPQLKGYYPDAKPLANSFLFSQEYISGIFLPITLEANYNADMCDVNKPFSVCHELCHLKGYMNEDEANFIAFAACVGSQSAEFRYCGYIAALEYIENYACEHGAVFNESEAVALNANSAEYDMYVFLPLGYWEEHKDDEVIPTEVMAEISETANDSYLKANGVDEGTESYSLAANLILNYYLVSGLPEKQ